MFGILGSGKSGMVGRMFGTRCRYAVLRNAKLVREARWGIGKASNNGKWYKSCKAHKMARAVERYSGKTGKSGRSGKTAMQV